MRLLGVLWARWASGDEGVTHIVAQYTGRGGRSLTGVLASLTEMADATVGDAVAWALRREALLGHLDIAARKLIASGRDTYHFISSDGLMMDGQWRAFDFTNPRLGNLSRFLADGRLHEDCRVTSDGHHFLASYAAA